MANEVTNSLLVTNGGRVSQVLSALVLEQLYDPTDLRRLMTFAPWQGPVGSATMRVTQDAVPGAFAAASSETSGGASNSAYTTSKFDLTVARYLRKYQMTDLFALTGGAIDPQRVVKKLMDGVALTMTDLLCALFPSLATSVGTTAVALSVDTIYSAQFALNMSNVMATPEQPYAAVLANRQMNHFRTSLRSETGSQQFQPATAEMLATRGPGYQGSWNGVEFYQSDSVGLVNANVDRCGAMFGAGCWVYTMAPVAPLLQLIPNSNVLIDAGELVVELSRDADNGMSSAIANIYPAVVEAEDLRGVEIISKTAA